MRSFCVQIVELHKEFKKPPESGGHEKTFRDLQRLGVLAKLVKIGQKVVKKWPIWPGKTEPKSGQGQAFF